AASWPDEREHSAALGPALGLLAARVATVRTLDFGADKTPPFLAGIDERGLELALAHPDALGAQLRAILRAGGETRLRLLFPLVAPLAAATPVVLAHIRDVVRAAHAVGRAVEVCGEAAGEPPVAALLVGLGVDELSVSPARLDPVRAAVRSLDAAEAAAAAAQAVRAESLEESLALGSALLSVEAA